MAHIADEALDATELLGELEKQAYGLKMLATLWGRLTKPCQAQVAVTK